LRSKPPDERLPLLLAARFAVRGKEEDGERNEMEWAEEGERERGDAVRAAERRD
jgi:hypothetical protein